jgi:hypothetical protein
VHAYERSKPLDASGNPVADGQGPVYVTFGGGGADPYPVTVQPYSVVAQTSFGYLLIDVMGKTLTVTAKDETGNVIDQFSLSK